MQGQEIINYSLFYKNINQDIYYQTSFESQDNTYYSAIISSDFINTSQIQYYIILETESNVISIPEINPEINPLFINIISDEILEINSNLKLDTNIEIISPIPNEKLYLDDLIVILSYYQLDDLDQLPANALGVSTNSVVGSTLKNLFRRA